MSEEVLLEGPDAEVRDFRVFAVTADLAMLSGYARAGFHSRAEFTDAAHVEIVVPPGARSVEISFDASNLVAFDTGRPGCLGGSGSGMTWRSVALWARDADGTYHMSDDALVDGIYLQLQTTPAPLPSVPLTACIIEPPVPPAPGLVVLGLPGLRIADPPPEGGRFLIRVEAGGLASTFLDGSAQTEHRIGISAITVRTEF